MAALIPQQPPPSCALGAPHHCYTAECAAGGVARLPPLARLNAAICTLDATGAVSDVWHPPQLMLWGFPKCGTSSMYDWLCQHPQVMRSVDKETHAFDNSHYAQGQPEGHADWRNESWTASKFKSVFEHHLRRDQIAVDATPWYSVYLNPRLIITRVQAWVPEPRFVVLLRNPCVGGRLQPAQH
eukprot:4021492-Prymnesium_polylepis.1